MQGQGFSINNISVKEYFEMQNTSDYDIFLDVLSPVNLFAGKVCNTNNLTYNEIELIKNYLKNANISNILFIFTIFFNLKGNRKESAESIFYRQSIFDLFRAKNFIVEFIIKNIEKENKMLSGIPDEKMQMLNAYKRLQPVSFLLSKMRLAKQLNCTPDDVGKMKYNKVFSYLIANKIDNDITNEYQQLK